ncbi:MAG: hypothetical protein FJX72_17905, partial [Armatimonadetes bacterium]|nr:hypothetical protein [Armatimonadota bacterium]
MRAQRSDSVGTVWGRAGIRRRVAFGASRRTFAFAALLVGAAVGCVGVQRAPTSTTPPAISYALEPVPATSSAEGYTRVRVTITGPPTIAGETPALRTTTERRLRLQMPVWTPGEYRVQNHARYVRGLRVVGDATQVGRPDHNTWDVSVPDSGTVEVRYELANAPPGIFTENVDVRSRRAFYSGPATFMYLPGRTQERVALEITAPPGWDGPITPLTADETPVTASRSAGVSAASDSAPASKAASPRAFAFTASTYDELADAPILIGDSLTRSFEIGGKRHRTTFMGRTGALDPGPYVETLRAIVRAGSDYMGGLPYPRYDLFLDVGGRGGGLEHANAARIAIAPYMPARAVARFMAHEYFHLWNVKRIRPAVLGPFDYANPPRTRDLWFCEGVTEYVAGLLALRAGLLDDGAFLSDISRSIGTLLAK